MGITVSPRDITFSFPGSCNSDCCNLREVASKRYYINTGGEVETYKRRKAREDTSKAFERSLSYLNKTLERKVISFKGDPEEFQDKADHVLKSIYNTKEINVAHLEAINDLMLDYLAERSPRSVRFDVREPSDDSLRDNKCLML